MTESNRKTVDVYPDRVSKIVVKMCDLFARKKYNPAEVYMACKVLMMDIESQFKIKPCADAEEFLAWWKTHTSEEAVSF